MFLFLFNGIQHYISISSIHFLIFRYFHLSPLIKAPPLFSLLDSLSSPPAALPMPPPVLPLTSLPTVPSLHQQLCNGDAWGGFVEAAVVLSLHFLFSSSSLGVSVIVSTLKFKQIV